MIGLLLALITELIVIGWKKSAIRKIVRASASTRRDQATCILSIFGILDAVGFFLTLGLPYLLGAKLVESFPSLQALQFISRIKSPVASILATVIVADLFLYLGHRWMHWLNPLWEIHKYHHAAEEMSVFAAYRNNPFARPIRGFVSAIPVTFLGASFSNFLLAAVFVEFITFITHSEIDHDWGWIGRWILISPRAHRTHHALEGNLHRSNYGNTFVIWDRLFGTYIATEAPAKFGVPDQDYNSAPIFDEMFASIRRIAISAKKAVRH